MFVIAAIRVPGLKLAPLYLFGEAQRRHFCAGLGCPVCTFQSWRASLFLIKFSTCGVRSQLVDLNRIVFPFRSRGRIIVTPRIQEMHGVTNDGREIQGLPREMLPESTASFFCSGVGVTGKRYRVAGSLWIRLCFPAKFSTYFDTKHSGIVLLFLVSFFPLFIY